MNRDRINPDTVTLTVTPALADLADARGAGVEELAAEALRRYVADEATRTRVAATGLAQRHQSLLRRLGE
ncbi:hypothetical protein ACGFRB_10900 [Streptomyces sp. NPDC048718]|uniref:hypothetical protein n=1 Tax=Streptomyces sp. NPDC048718 TaxID=3365587 RepID=UPI003722CA82